MAVEDVTAIWFLEIRMAWRDLLEGFRRGLRRFVTLFEQSEELDPSEGEVRTLLRHVTTHERALLEFVTRELESRPENRSNT